MIHSVACRIIIECFLVRIGNLISAPPRLHPPSTPLEEREGGGGGPIDVVYLISNFVYMIIMYDE